MTSDVEEARGQWRGFNNIGIAVTAIAAVLENTRSLTLPKAMLIMPLVMHEATLRYLANGNVRARRAAAFAIEYPEFIVNFDKRFDDSLVVSLNAIQFLTETKHVEFAGSLNLLRSLKIDSSYGKRALLIERASKNISALLSSADAELYLNLRVKL